MKPIVKPVKKSAKASKTPKVNAPKKVGKGVYAGKHKQDNSME